jgi:subtilisin family serine protease
VATPTPVPGATQSIAVNASATLSARLTNGSFSTSLSVPVTSAQTGTTASLTLTPTAPIAIGQPSSRLRHLAYVDANTLYLVVSTTGSFSTAQTPAFTFSGLPQFGQYTLGQMTVGASGTSANTPIAAESASSGNIAFAPTAAGLTVSAGTYLIFTLSPGGAGAPSPTPGPDAAYACPSSDSDTSSARGDLAQAHGDAVRRLPRRRATSAPNATRLEVIYDRSVANGAARTIAGREEQLGARLVRSIDFAYIGRRAHVLAVPADRAAATEAALRSELGVEQVAVSGSRRRPSTVAQRYFTHDPYFTGFNAIAPDFESFNPQTDASVPGQWDMHDIGLDDAFEYSQPGNGSKVQNAAALGSSSVTIAVIDTGEDPTHPELSGKIRLQHCFVTDPNTEIASSTDFETDPDGHGTDVAGIAAAKMDDGIGFVGAGGNTLIAAYRVFPEPDDSCESAAPDAQCGADTADIAAAIEDAVSSQVNVISMSLGGYIENENQGCISPGVDGDLVEGSAVADAIAAGIVVVAAAGNDGNGALEAPACDTGVIAVGASALDDGQGNGSGHTGGTATTPVDYVASYSDYDSTDASTPRSASAWGIVASGGDPQGASDADDLHWIENIWTSTPFTATPGDVTFAGQCTADYPNTTDVTPPVDCRTLIAGTSMATPHVAGAAALIIAVNSTYQSPTKMKQLLCSTADGIADPHQGCGRLNVYRAMATALGDSALP